MFNKEIQQLKKSNEIRQLKQSELAPLREDLHTLQNNVCPIIKQEFPIEEMTIDHQHKQKKSDENGVNGGGLVRGCIHFQANAFEGKVTNAYKRCGIHKFLPLPLVLRRLADYLEQPNLPLIHPSEKPADKKLKKTSYNLLRKTYDGKAKFPAYPKSGKLTAPLKKLFDKYNIKPEFYK